MAVEHGQTLSQRTRDRVDSAAGAPLMISGRSAGTAAVTTLSTGGGVSVQVCGRLVTVPHDATSTLSLLCRHLAQQLKISGHASLQFADVSGHRINGDQELAAALQEGRHPLQASMTVSALREIEQKKSEVETKKEELAQFQWQVVVDQMAAVSAQVTAVAAQLQSVKDDCTRTVQKAQDNEALLRERMEEAITRETQQRELGLKDVETKIDKLVQAICAERSARDVATHQLSAQLEQSVASVEADRVLRSQERAEMERVLQTMRHQVDAEAARNEEQWSWHTESAKRLDARLEERATADVAQQMRLAELEAGAERLRTSVASVESALAAQQRTTQELMNRRGEELSKAVRDEILGRENHIARFAKELETSWQSLEARMQRGREEAATANGVVAERARVLEERCHQVEQEFSNHVLAQTEQNHILAEKAHLAAASVDAMELTLKSSDVVTQTTVSRVEDLLERLVALEDDCKTKVSADYWQPQMDALNRADQKFENKLGSLEKDLLARLAQEAAQRDGVKQQLQETLKSCMDKIVGSRPQGTANRFIEVHQPEDGMMTPRCTFTTGVNVIPGSANMVSATTSSVRLPTGSATQTLHGVAGSATSGAKVLRQVSVVGGAMSPPNARPVFVSQCASPRAMSPQAVASANAIPAGNMVQMFSPRT